MANQTLIQIPMGGELGDPARLRIFLLRLIEKLDIILGYRGGDAYVTQSDLNNAQSEINLADLTLLSLAQQIEQLSRRVTSNTEAIEANTEIIEEIQQGTSISKLNFSQVNPSVAYDQVEAQSVADQAKNAGDKIDELFDILETAGIIVT